MLLSSLKYPLMLFIFISALATQEAFAQSGTFEVTGSVVDGKDKISIPGVNVIEKGTSNGVSTDFDGGFKLNVKSANAILVVSYIGYKTQEIEVKGRRSITIELAEDAQALEDTIRRRNQSQRCYSNFVFLNRQKTFQSRRCLVGFTRKLYITSPIGCPRNECPIF